MGVKKHYTVADIANELGTSKATVSRALNDESGVGPELRQKIKEIAGKVGYQPRTSASALRKGKLKIVGLIFGDIRNPFYSELTYYIQKILSDSGYATMLFNTRYIAEKEKNYLHLAQELGLSGVILYTAQTTMTRAEFENISIPVIFVNRSLQFADYDSVFMDNFKGGYNAATHLIELGHRRIGFIRGLEGSPSSLQRFEGFESALKNYGIPLLEKDIMDGDLSMERGSTLAAEFWQRDSRASALVIANDLMAMGFIDYCNENKIKIPENLSIISFDNIIFSKIHGIGLTTVSQEVKLMGTKAAEAMLQRMEHPESDYIHAIIEPVLIVRDTTAPFTK